MKCVKVNLKHGQSIENVDATNSESFPGFIKICKRDGTYYFINADSVSSIISNKREVI